MYNTPVPQTSDLPLVSDPEEIFDAKFFAFWASFNFSVEKFNEAIRAIGLDHVASSNSSHEIGYGEKSWQVEPGRGFATGMTLKCVPLANINHYVQGQVKSYNIATGGLIVVHDQAVGEGIYDNWSIALAIAGNGSVGGGGGANLRYLETTGTGADYIATLEIPITAIEDGNVFNVQFHTANVANATLKISGINPALDLKVQASDGAYVNVAANDIVAGHQCLVRIGGDATFAIIEPATSLEALAAVVANTTFTLANALDRTIISTGLLTHVLPLMGEFPVNGSFTVLNESGACTINRQGLDNIKFNGSSLTSLLVPPGGSVTFINRGTEWIAVGSAASSAGFSNIAVFNTAGTFTFNVPNGIRKIKATLVGPGGNGGSAANTGGVSVTIKGGDGGGGGVCVGTFDVTPNSAISVVVGAPGGITSLGSLCSATGGAVGQSVSSTAGVIGANGAGGVGIGGQINLPQLKQGWPYFGFGMPDGNTAIYDNTKKNAIGYGAGGIGHSAGTVSSGAGGIGAPGLIIIEY